MFTRGTRTAACSLITAMTSNHLWGIVLAGSTEHRPGRPRVPSSTRHILFRQALDRAARLIEPDRLYAVLARDHGAYYDTELSDLPGVRRIRQPAYRGSAPELFLPVLRIFNEDPHATVVVIPSDQLVDGEARLMSYVGRAAQAVARRPDLVVVIGAHPLGVEVPCTWIDPGELVEGLESLSIREIRRFVTRPTRGEGVHQRAGQRHLAGRAWQVARGVSGSRSKTVTPPNSESEMWRGPRPTHRPNQAWPISWSASERTKIVPVTMPAPQYSTAPRPGAAAGRIVSANVHAASPTARRHECPGARSRRTR